MFSDLSAPRDDSSLLCRPTEDLAPVFERASPAYSPCFERFGVGERSFSRQYAHIYAARLMQMRPLLTEKAEQKWGMCYMPECTITHTAVFLNPYWQSIKLDARLICTFCHLLEIYLEMFFRHYTRC